jgi:hypothetical protein
MGAASASASNPPNNYYHLIGRTWATPSLLAQCLSEILLVHQLQYTKPNHTKKKAHSRLDHYALLVIDGVAT